ncbi:MAG: CYTH domain-containing protein, partial [Gemmatimonadetes bacterium]|nr:CYTH domain-containing protein [Gemmatimonadota bacterium]
MDAVLRLAVHSREELDEIESAALPLALRSSSVSARFHRDLYFDTPDQALERRGVTCRIRLCMDGWRGLIVTLRERGGDVSFGHRARYTAQVTDADPPAALGGPSEPARILQAIVDPARLSAIIEMETERRVRVARRGWIWRSSFEIHYDDVTVRSGGAAVRFQEIHIHWLRRGHPTLDELSGALRRQWRLTPILADRLARAQRLIDEREAAILEHGIRESREVAVIPFDFGRLGFMCEGDVCKVPTGEGTGEKAARAVLESRFGTGQAQIRLLGSAPAAGLRPQLEVWLARRIPDVHSESPTAAEWLGLDEAIARVGTPALRDPRTLAALHVAVRSNLMIERDVWRSKTAVQMPSWIRDPELEEPCLDPDCGDPRHFINENLSLLAFHARVLAMAEDPSLPLLERLRFLAIFSANMDEFFMIAVGKRKRAIAEGRHQPTEDGMTPVEELDAIAVLARRLFAQAYRCLGNDLAPALAEQGIRILQWSELSAEQRRQAWRIFRDEIYPLLTPLAASPAHPFPHIPNLRLSLLALTRDPRSGIEHLLAVPTPEGLPRFIRLPNTRDFIPSEALISANLSAITSGMEVLRVHWFRVTRSGDIRYHEDRVRDLLQEIEEEVERRPYAPVLRVEIEPALPQEMRELLVQEFRFESRDEPSTLAESDLYEVDWLPDMAGLKEIA